MGYTRNRVYKLVFDDPSMEGLEVRARSVKLKQMLKMMHLTGKDERNTGQVEEMLDIFASALVSWNLEDEMLDESGEPTGVKLPVPANREGLESQDFDFVFEIILAWMGAVMSVAGPLGQRLTSGAQSLEASMPMETLSPSPPP